MDIGLREGYDKLDDLLTTLCAAGAHVIPNLHLGP